MNKKIEDKNQSKTGKTVVAKLEKVTEKVTEKVSTFKKKKN
tara:strand:+ start:169 stop:291 length:123 start_codon:yes stop_codon:yes gene_type:complete